MHAARDQIVDRRRAAAIGNVHDIGAARVFEQLAADVARRSIAGGGVEKLARVVFCVSDELRHRLERQRRRDREQEVPARDDRHRLQVALDVVRQLRHHVSRDRERADRSHADGVSVGLSLCSQVETNGERPARPIIDHDLLSQLLSELGAKNARHSVGRAAGSLRDDQPDGPIRVLRRRAGRKRAGEERQSESKHVADLASRDAGLRRGVFRA